MANQKPIDEVRIGRVKATSAATPRFWISCGVSLLVLLSSRLMLSLAISGCRAEDGSNWQARRLSGGADVFFVRPQRQRISLQTQPMTAKHASSATPGRRSCGKPRLASSV